MVTGSCGGPPSCGQMSDIRMLSRNETGGHWNVRREQTLIKFPRRTTKPCFPTG
ncbi:hypothetical protein MOKP38_45190 [Mycobacterium avium subsp. hominissuis]